MLLVDTNILIDYLRQNPLAIAFVARNEKRNLALSPIVVMEIFQGVLNKVDLQRTRKVLTGFTVLDLNPSITRLAM